MASLLSGAHFAEIESTPFLMDMGTSGCEQPMIRNSGSNRNNNFITIYN